MAKLILGMIAYGPFIVGTVELAVKFGLLH
jgi:hypothetical protein